MQAVGSTVSDLTSQRFEPQTSRFKVEGVIQYALANLVYELTFVESLKVVPIFHQFFRHQRLECLQRNCALMYSFKTTKFSILYLNNRKGKISKILETFRKILHKLHYIFAC